MGWKIVERRIGRAGNQKQQLARQLAWDKKYGRDNWMVGYMVDNQFISSDDAFDAIYYPSYVKHFEEHPADLEELISTAKSLRNPHAEATGGVDLQVPAILKYLQEHELKLKGNELVDIGTYGNLRSHKLSVRLSPLQVRVFCDEKRTIEQYWQEKKVLVVWE